MLIYYSGAEIPAHRKTLAANGIEHAALSYMGLRRRTKMIRPWMLQERLKEPLTLLLDSGGHTVNAAPENYNYDVPALVASYELFVEGNAVGFTPVERVLEFDAIVMGADARRRHRDKLTETVGSRFVPVWHKEYGAFELRLLASRYGAVAVADLDADGRDLTTELKAIAHDAELFGLAMLKPDKMKAIPFHAVTGTSWLSPSQHGETVIYAGGELHRYHKQYQDQVRRRYRTQIGEMGLDAEKVAAGDREELLSLSLRSWQRFADELATKAPVTPSQRNGAPAMYEPDNEAPETGHGPVMQAPRRRARTAMPGVAVEVEQPPEQAEEGAKPKETISRLRVVDLGVRACDSCYLKGKCPAYEPQSACAYEIPVELDKPQQIKALRTALIKMQTDRVLFLRLAEEVEGGYADPVLSTELDRLSRMLAGDHKIDQSSFSLNITGSAGPNAPTLSAGIISTIFGRDPQQRAIEAPAPADPFISQIMDAEVVDETIEH